MTYFRKYLLSNPVILSDGSPVPWEPLPGNRGCLMVDEAQQPALVAELRAHSSQKKGGVVEVTLAQFEELKKKSASLSPQQSFRQRNEQSGMRIYQAGPPKASAAAVEAASVSVREDGHAAPTLSSRLNRAAEAAIARAKAGATAPASSQQFIPRVGTAPVPA